MKFLIASDIHSAISNLEKIIETENFDILLIAGDLTNFNKDDLLKIDEILSEEGVECYAVHGNCDYEEFLKLDLDSINFIHGRSIKIRDIKIYGVGGSLPTPFGTPSEYPEDYFAELLSKLEFSDSDFNILLSHNPAKGVLDRTKHGENVGSEEIRKRLKNFRIIISGHVHECSGVYRDKIIALNPGPIAWGMFAILEPDEIEIKLKRLKSHKEKSFL